MKNVSSLFFTVVLYSQATFAANSIKCDIDNFNIPNVDITTKVNQDIKKAAANFMLDNSYWSISVYELMKNENFYLLKGIDGLKQTKDIHRKLYENYNSRLNNKFFYSTKFVESNPAELSSLKGVEYILEADFKDQYSEIHKNEDIFILRVATTKNKVFLAELHVNHVKKIELTINKAKKIINNFSNICRAT